MIPVTPSFKVFSELSRKGNLIPVYTEILADLETPVSSFLKIDRSDYSFLLESVEGGQSQARYSFLGSGPETILEVQNGRFTVCENGVAREKPCRGDPLPELQKILKNYRFVELPELPRFCGGAIGFMSYDCNRFYERVRPARAGDAVFPDLFFMVANTLVVFDHVKRRIMIVSNAFLPRGASAADKKKIYDATVAKIEALLETLKSSHAHAASASSSSNAPSAVHSNFTERGFKKAVREVKRHIRKGDVIQTVISQRFRMNVSGKDFDIYRALRSINPSPYMFYLKCGSFTMVGSSPEVHVRCENGRVTLRPIAGTRPRGKTPREDALFSEHLLKDPKERAEHVMLVDLGRNDLGRVCRLGSVGVDQFMTIERYSHVMHLVSEVTGKLLAQKDLYDVIRATFPAGTVTGAPKVRAMEIISELEPERRGPYAGLVGYLSFSGNFDSCITIRTIVLKNGAAFIQAGAGIVADSDPHKEWMETHNKARGLLKAIQMTERGLE